MKLCHSKAWVVLSLALLPACGGEAGLAAASEEYDEAAQALQSFWVTINANQDAAGWVNMLTTESMSVIGRSFGAIRSAAGSCGATFISPHYAVTAAHCVADASNHLLSSFTIQQINTSQVNLTSVTNSTAVSGTTWGTWSHPQMTRDADGYTVYTWHCEVTKSCSHTFGGQDDCAGLGGETDIALVKCSDRTHAYWVPARQQPVANGAAVETWWFHELVNLDTSPTTHTVGPANNWAHYGDHAAAENWHYTTQHQVLPLRSRHWKNSAATNYKYLDEIHGSPTSVFSDTPSCHGTSGSGVLLNGGTELIGPVVRPFGSWGYTGSVDGLCGNFSGMAPGAAAMGLIRPNLTNTFQAAGTPAYIDRPH